MADTGFFYFRYVCLYLLNFLTKLLSLTINSLPSRVLKANFSAYLDLWLLELKLADFPKRITKVKFYINVSVSTEE